MERSGGQAGPLTPVTRQSASYPHYDPVDLTLRGSLRAEGRSGCCEARFISSRLDRACTAGFDQPHSSRLRCRLHPSRRRRVASLSHRDRRETGNHSSARQQQPRGAGDTIRNSSRASRQRRTASHGSGCPRVCRPGLPGITLRAPTVSAAAGIGVDCNSESQPFRAYTSDSPPRRRASSIPRFPLRRKARPAGTESDLDGMSPEPRESGWQDSPPSPFWIDHRARRKVQDRQLRQRILTYTQEVAVHAALGLIGSQCLDCNWRVTAFQRSSPWFCEGGYFARPLQPNRHEIIDRLIDVPVSLARFSRSASLPAAGPTRLRT